MRDERGLVGRAAITLMVLVVIFGLAAIDGGSVFLAKLQMSDTADAAATAGWESWNNVHNAKLARTAAAEAAHERDPSSRIAGFTVTRTGTVTVTVRDTATTLFLKRIGPLKRFAVVESTASVSG
jgi:Flp pilus assembly protein TadG